MWMPKLTLYFLHIDALVKWYSSRKIYFLKNRKKSCFKIHFILLSLKFNIA